MVSFDGVRHEVGPVGRNMDPIITHGNVRGADRKVTRGAAHREVVGGAIEGEEVLLQSPLRTPRLPADAIPRVCGFFIFYFLFINVTEKYHQYYSRHVLAIHTNTI